ncbi:unnamed protein product [Adineta ricciae]|uniref:G-protein coupled receptors family 1 profile domain-containing protein n=1 Tax=Adineta ricciae TaxID=249248 RepID=A0A815ICC5_ADIRI|nr:unnamed protein product [Adineta ricciae]CAF1630967.1 unnamed protein product [Adineta ricciae]
MLPNVSFTLITLISSASALLVTFTLSLIIFIHIRNTRDIGFLLMLNTYVAMFAFSFIIFFVHIHVLGADLYGLVGFNNTDELNTCRFQGFLIYTTFGCCCNSFVLQAFYRYTRIVYSKKRIFQSFTFYIVCILFQWMMDFLLVLPQYLWPGIIYTLYTLDYYCGILYEQAAAMWCTGIVIYIFPVIFISLIYMSLMRFIRRQTSNLHQTGRMRTVQRDSAVIRRILFIVNTLTLPGMPNIIHTIMVNIDRSKSGLYNMYRIQWMFPAIGIFIFSIALVFLTPQFKVLIFDTIYYRNNRVIPMEQRRIERQLQTQF